MSFREVSLKIRPPPHSWVADLLKYRPVRVEILDCKPVSKNKVNEVFELKCNPKIIKEIEKKLRSSKYIDYIEILTLDVNKGKMYGVVRTSHCSVCRLFSNSAECFLGSAIYDVEDKYVKWRLIAHVSLLKDIVDRLRRNGIEVRVESIASVNLRNRSSTALTFKQERILKLALRLGFFEFPRKITLLELSKLLDLSPSTVAEALRASLKKVVNFYFKEQEKYSKKKTERSE